MESIAAIVKQGGFAFVVVGNCDDVNASVVDEQHPPLFTRSSLVWEWCRSGAFDLSFVIPLQADLMTD